MVVIGDSTLSDCDWISAPRAGMPGKRLLCRHENKNSERKECDGDEEPRSVFSQHESNEPVQTNREPKYQRDQGEHERSVLPKPANCCDRPILTPRE